MEKHLIVSANKKFQIYDWTPFYNRQQLIPLLTIINKEDLICKALDLLSMEGWKIKTTFIDSKYFYFLLIKQFKKRENLYNRLSIERDNEAIYDNSYPISENLNNLEPIYDNTSNSISHMYQVVTPVSNDEQSLNSDSNLENEDYVIFYPNLSNNYLDISPNNTDI